MTTGVGVVLRNEDSVRIQGYSVNLGRCSIEEAEFWAVIHGMKMAREMGVKRLLVESDCLLVVQWLRGSDETTPFLASLIQECRDWMRKGWIINIQHVYK